MDVDLARGEVGTLTAVLIPVAACLAAYGVWSVTAPAALAQAHARLLTALGIVWDQRAGQVAKRRAQTLGWVPYRVPAIAAIWTMIAAAGLAALSPQAALFGLVPTALAAWLLALQSLAGSFAGWQREMLRGLPGLVTTLRVQLDLGLTVPEALRESMRGASPVMRRELELALADMATADQAKEGLVRLAARTENREWRVFADTLSQAWDTQLSGDALEPLLQLVAIVREQQARETTGKLERVASTAPGLALLAIAILAAGGYLLSALAGGGGL